jgi:hypothetical protein
VLHDGQHSGLAEGLSCFRQYSLVVQVSLLPLEAVGEVVQNPVHCLGILCLEGVSHENAWCRQTLRTDARGLTSCNGRLLGSEDCELKLELLHLIKQSQHREFGVCE